MTRGIRLEPKFDISYTVRDLTLDTAPVVDQVFGKAMNEVKDMIRLKDPKQAIDAAVEIGEREPNIVEVKDALIHKAMQTTDGNIRAAAKLLGVAERTLYRWVNNKGKEVLL